MQDKPYITTLLSTRNYLSNISHNRVVKEDLYKRNFVIDIYILLTKNLNPFSLEWKIPDQSKHELIYMLRKERMQADFNRFMSQEENFLYLNGKHILHPKLSEMVWLFISQDDKNCNLLRDNLCSFKDIVQYTYSVIYPDIYCRTERRAFDLKSSFQLVFKAYKDKKG